MKFNITNDWTISKGIVHVEFFSIHCEDSLFESKVLWITFLGFAFIWEW